MPALRRIYGKLGQLEGQLFFYGQQKLVNINFSAGSTDSQTYEVGETVGPYNVAPGKTADMPWL